MPGMVNWPGIVGTILGSGLIGNDGSGVSSPGGNRPGPVSIPLGI